MFDSARALLTALCLILAAVVPLRETKAAPPTLALSISPPQPLNRCFEEAGARHRIDPLLLYAIAQVESRLRPDAINYNRNGSVDYGVMQINSMHLPVLKQHGIDAQRLMDEPCTSIQVGACLLADMIQREGYSWDAVGAYNAGLSPNRAVARARYAAKVWERYDVLQRERAQRNNMRRSGNFRG